MFGFYKAPKFLIKNSAFTKKDFCGTLKAVKARRYQYGIFERLYDRAQCVDNREWLYQRLYDLQDSVSH